MSNSLAAALNGRIAPVKRSVSLASTVDTLDASSENEVSKELATKYPSLGGHALSLIGKVVTAVFKDQHTPSGKESQPLSPFMSTPSSMGATTSPSAVVEFLRAEGIHIPLNGKEMNPSLNALSYLSGIPSGTLSSLNMGRMKMDGAKLEQWRNSLVLIGKANDNEWLVSFENPETYLDSLIEDYESMASALPLERIRDWAINHSSMLSEHVEAKLGKVSVSALQYVDSIIGVWRHQYVSDCLENLSGCIDFMSVIKSYTGHTSIKRGFNKLVPTVHRGMAQFNDRIRYQVKLTAPYTQRYTGTGNETGLTAEILLAYCFYLGMNPMALLRWLAEAELRNPGSHLTEGTSFDINNLVGWSGVLSPWEFNRFVVLISSLGLVSDQEKWALCVYDASNIYRNIPTKADIDRSLGDKAMTFDEVTTNFFHSNPDMPTSCKVIGAVPYSKLSGELQIDTMIEPQAYQNVFWLYALGDQSMGEVDVDEINGKVLKMLRRVYRNAFAPEDLGKVDRTYTNLSPLDHTRMVVADTIYKGVCANFQLEVNTSSL